MHKDPEILELGGRHNQLTAQLLTPMTSLTTAASTVSTVIG